MKNLQNRFKSITKNNWIIIIAMSAIMLFGLYMSISISVKLSQGLTVFGDSTQKNNILETVGPTQADITLVTFFWIMTGLLLILDVFYIFFKDQKSDVPVRKEIVDGKTVIVQEDNNDHTSTQD